MYAVAVVGKSVSQYAADQRARRSRFLWPTWSSAASSLAGPFPMRMKVIEYSEYAVRTDISRRLPSSAPIASSCHHRAQDSFSDLDA